MTLEGKIKKGADGPFFLTYN